jgi:gamma-glutamylcyclotransferase
MISLTYLNYFAYGSNMSPERLQKRVPSARIIGVYSLIRHELKFHKIGKDGSAKADAFFTGQDADVVLGVLYSIEGSEKKWLDEAEGLGSGYEEKEVSLINENGQTIVGFLYYATDINSALRPFSWYVHHILNGARTVKLPERYVQQIDSVQTIEDDDRQRDTLERSLYIK